METLTEDSKLQAVEMKFLKGIAGQPMQTELKQIQ
jgi:hypothetical protein